MTPPPLPPARFDTRFAAIDDARALLEMLPPPDKIVWPRDPGDEQTIAEALDWIADWAPKARREFKRHRREQRDAARNGRGP